jgi:predicted MFS family arabinose efflux permease
LLVVRGVPSPRRAVAIGVKQAGVQLSAFAAGLALPPLADLAGWRVGMAAAAMLPAVLLVVVWATVPRDPPATGTGPWLQWPLSDASPWLATVNTYLPLYASQQLKLAGPAAGSVLAAFGVAGLVARVAWTRLADRLAEVTVALWWLALAAAGGTLLLPLAAGTSTWLVWAGAIAVGSSATAANAVSMLAVVRRGGATGHISALVSLGFFGGFVVGPIVSGLLADHTGWSAVWLGVAMVFTGAAVAGALLSRSGWDAALR